MSDVRTKVVPIENLNGENVNKRIVSLMNDAIRKLELSDIPYVMCSCNVEVDNILNAKWIREVNDIFETVSRYQAVIALREDKYNHVLITTRMNTIYDETSYDRDNLDKHKLKEVEISFRVRWSDEARNDCRIKNVSGEACCRMIDPVHDEHPNIVFPESVAGMTEECLQYANEAIFDNEVNRNNYFGSMIDEPKTKIYFGSMVISPNADTKLMCQNLISISNYQSEFNRINDPYNHIKLGYEEIVVTEVRSIEVYVYWANKEKAKND